MVFIVLLHHTKRTTRKNPFLTAENAFSALKNQQNILYILFGKKMQKTL